MDSITEKTVSVRLLDTLPSVDREYSYRAPAEAGAGMLVLVPFGRADRPVCGVVTGAATDESVLLLKHIIRILDYPIVLTQELLDLCAFLSDRCMCTYGSVMKAIIPPGFNVRADEKLFAVPIGELEAFAKLSEQCEALYAFILAHAGCRTSDLPFDNAAKLLRPLLKNGFVRRTYEFKRRINERNERCVELMIPEEQAEMYLSGALKSPSAKALTVIELLLQNPSVTLDEITQFASCGKTVVDTLVKHNIARVYLRRTERTPPREYNKLPPPVLSDEQQKAFEQISELMDAGKPECALLYGVTGSGKTKVIIAAVQKALDCGKQAIVLVPEIGLASQAVELFMSHFGSRVTVIHSGLSAGERIDAYRRIAEGAADVVIGTRSAIFAPCDNIGLIAIDEEQEHTYLSEMTPKYSAVESAKFRSMKHNSLLLLASATPSVESFYRARKGIYKLIRLRERYGNALIPEVHFADLREDTSLTPDRMIGMQLRQEIAKNLENGEQTILFLNRRGYRSAVICRSCGQTVYCPNCSVPMALHLYRGRKVLACHYCGASRPLDGKCPSCSSTALSYTGYGTQSLEEELTELFPEARKIRMDGDTTAAKGSHDEIYERFKSRQADILYGTQMITKGLDFPSVTLVGIILADASLYQTDFRACERTFSSLTQVIGRAGRADKAGRAIIQTYSPSHRTLVLAGQQDYDTFFSEDIMLRHAVLFPPFCDMALFIVSGEDENDVRDSSQSFAKRLVDMKQESCPEQAMILFGPFDDVLYRLDGKYRRRIVVKFKNSLPMRDVFRRAMQRKNKDTTYISADINPSVI